MAEGLPAMLTVEEAAALLRIGRTKAYAMATEWRASDGRSGLPVVDLGHVLRVPRHALEALVGGELTGLVAAKAEARPATTTADVAKPATSERDRAKARRRTRSQSSTEQLDLFQVPSQRD